MCGKQRAPRSPQPRPLPSQARGVRERAVGSPQERGLPAEEGGARFPGAMSAFSPTHLGHCVRGSAEEEGCLVSVGGIQRTFCGVRCQRLADHLGCHEVKSCTVFCQRLKGNTSRGGTHRGTPCFPACSPAVEGSFGQPEPFQEKGMSNGIVEPFRLEETFKSIKSNHQLNTTMPTNRVLKCHIYAFFERLQGW